MRRSEAGRAVLLALLAAHFQASPALEEKKGKAARAAVLPVLGGRASAGPPRNARLGSGRRGTSGARRGGPRSPERGFPVRSPVLRRVEAPASAWCGAGASRHVRQQSARARGTGRGAGSIPPPRTSGTGAALRTRAPPPGRLSDPASPPPGAPLTLRARPGHQPPVLRGWEGRPSLRHGPSAAPLPPRAAPGRPRPPRRWALVSGGFPGLPRLAPTCSLWAACPRCAVEWTERWDRPRRDSRVLVRTPQGRNPSWPGPRGFKTGLTASFPPQNPEIFLFGMCLLAF